MQLVAKAFREVARATATHGSQQVALASANEPGVSSAANGRVTMTEARLWQTLGGGAVGGGIAAVVVPMISMGTRPETNLLLSIDLAGAFIMLAGATAFVAARVMASMDHYSESESRLWRTLGILCIVAGIGVVAFTGLRVGWGMPTVNQVWLGIVGSSMLLVGINLLVGNRVMEQAHRAGNNARAARA